MAKVMVVDYYKTPNSAAINRIVKTVESAGFEAEVKRHRDIRKAIKPDAEGNVPDILTDYHKVVSSGGTDRPWKKTGTNATDGRAYMQTKDPVQEYFVNHKKPLYSICGSAQAAAQALGYNVKNSGKFNRGKGDDGQHFNHKFGIEANNLDKRVKNLETVDHADGQYVKSMDVGNNRLVQYHPERTDIGRQEMVKFLRKNAPKDSYKIDNYRNYDQAKAA